MTEPGPLRVPVVWPERSVAPEEHFPPSGATPRHAGLRYSTPVGYRPIELDLYHPGGSGDVPVVIWVHGGGFHEGTRRVFPPTIAPTDPVARVLASGMAVALVDYRLSHESPFPAQLHDLKAAVRYLRRHATGLGLDGSRIAIWGESAGGHLASMVGLTADSADPKLEGSDGTTGESSAVHCVIDWYGVTDFGTMPVGSMVEFLVTLGLDVSQLTDEERIPELDAFLGRHPASDPEFARWASPVAHVSHAAPPFLIVHGSADSVVPFEQSQLLHDALVAVGAASELLSIPGAEHIFGGYPRVDELTDAAIGFVARHLGQGADDAGR